MGGGRAALFEFVHNWTKFQNNERKIHFDDNRSLSTCSQNHCNSLYPLNLQIGASKTNCVTLTENSLRDFRKFTSAELLEAAHFDILAKRA